MIISFIRKHFSDLGLIWRYIVSGIAAGVVQFSFFYIFFDIFGWWYLLATSLGFCVAYVVGFGLQKYWTFKDNSTDRMYHQSLWYLFIALASLVENIVLMFVFVEWFDWPALISQVITIGIVAGISFIFNKTITFKHNGTTDESV